MSEKAQWQNQTDFFSNTDLQCPPPVCRCTAGGVAQTEPGLHQGCSLDRANSLDQWPAASCPLKKRQVRSWWRRIEAYPLLTIASSSRLQRGKQGQKKTASASMVTGQLWEPCFSRESVLRLPRGVLQCILSEGRFSWNRRLISE